MKLLVMDWTAKVNFLHRDTDGVSLELRAGTPGNTH
jgi:hypothetical protein